MGGAWGMSHGLHRRPPVIWGVLMASVLPTSSPIARTLHDRLWLQRMSITCSRLSVMLPRPMHQIGHGCYCDRSGLHLMGLLMWMQISGLRLVWARVDAGGRAALGMLHGSRRRRCLAMCGRPMVACLMMSACDGLQGSAVPSVLSPSLQAPCTRTCGAIRLIVSASAPRPSAPATLHCI